MASIVAGQAARQAFASPSGSGFRGGIEQTSSTSTPAADERRFISGSISVRMKRS